jgi:hypothetical protein
MSGEIGLLTNLASIALPKSAFPPVSTVQCGVVHKCKLIRLFVEMT